MRFRYAVNRPLWGVRMRFLKCFLLGSQPLDPKIFAFNPALQRRVQGLLSEQAAAAGDGGGGSAGGAKDGGGGGGAHALDGLDAETIDGPTSSEAKQQLTERRISVMDVMAGWEAKKEKKPKNGGEGKRR